MNRCRALEAYEPDKAYRNDHGNPPKNHAAEQKDLARGTATLDEVTKSNECCLKGLDELKKQLEIEQQMLNKKKPTS